MRVQTAEVQLQSQREVNRTQVQTARVDRGVAQVGGATDLPKAQRVDAVQLSPQAGAVEVQHREFPLEEEELAPQHELKLELAKRIIEKMLGSRFNFLRPNDLVSAERQWASGTAAVEAVAAAQGPPPPAEQAPPVQVGGPTMVELSYYSFYAETESTLLSAQGLVETADGQQIEVDLSLQLRRSFVSDSSVNVHAAKQRLADPVVVSFNGNAADLSERSFAFDLDADGFEEQIALTGSSSAVLSLDRDSYSKDAHGGDLFGSITGAGFSAQQDDDDGSFNAAAAVYDRLRLWTVDDNGDRALMALGDKDIGALYLGHVDTSFQVRSDEASPVGQGGPSGYLVPDDGGAGTARHVDLVA